MKTREKKWELIGVRGSGLLGEKTRDKEGNRKKRLSESKWRRTAGRKTTGKENWREWGVYTGFSVKRADKNVDRWEGGKREEGEKD